MSKGKRGRAMILHNYKFFSQGTERKDLERKGSELDYKIICELLTDMHFEICGPKTEMTNLPAEVLLYIIMLFLVHTC